MAVVKSPSHNQTPKMSGWMKFPRIGNDKRACDRLWRSAWTKRRQGGLMAVAGRRPFASQNCTRSGSQMGTRLAGVDSPDANCRLRGEGYFNFLGNAGRLRNWITKLT